MCVGVCRSTVLLACLNGTCSGYLFPYNMQLADIHITNIVSSARYAREIVAIPKLGVSSPGKLLLPRVAVRQWIVEECLKGLLL